MEQGAKMAWVSSFVQCHTEMTCRIIDGYSSLPDEPDNAHCGSGVIEIKCSFNSQFPTVADYTDCGNCCFYTVSHSELRKSHAYYSQVQAQIHACRVQYFDFLWYVCCTDRETVLVFDKVCLLPNSNYTEHVNNEPYWLVKALPVLILWHCELYPLWQRDYWNKVPHIGYDS